MSGDPISWARAEIERASSVAEVKGLRDKVESLRKYAAASGQGRNSINDYAEAKVRAEHKGGRLLREIERDPGAGGHQRSPQTEASLTPYQQALAEASISKAMAERWQVMAWLPDAALEAYFAKTREAGKIITSEDVFRLGKKCMPHVVVEPVTPEGTYSVLVIDPPWPMEKIEREVRPNQAGFDYRTMDEAELRDFGKVVRAMQSPDCHAFIWTTQKFLPMAIRLLEPWGLRYVLTMVWHKPGGFQPVGLPQYNCEFIVYARAGSPEFIDTKAFNCCFEAPRREHSRKPDQFYDTIRRVTSGPRIDVFSREAREGFDQYGDQIEAFAGAA